MISGSLGFFTTRIFVGLLGFAAVAVFSRIAPPEAYGRYALVMAAAGAVNACAFSWMGLFVLRRCNGQQERDTWLPTVIVAYLAMAGALSAVLCGAWLLFQGDDTPTLDYFVYLPIVALLLSWFDLSIQMSRARLQAGIFAAKSFAKALLGFGLGAAFVLMGWVQEGLLLGVCVGLGVVTVIWLRSDVRGISLAKPKREQVSTLLTFGVPLGASFAVNWVVEFADRFLIFWFLGDGAAAAGAYAMAYDLAKQPILLLASACSLVTLPLAARAYDGAGPRAAQPILAQNLSVLLLVCLPLCLMEFIAARPIVELLLGPSYRDTAAAIMPIVAVSVFISALRIYHFDLALHLTKRTGVIFRLTALTALVNVAANLVLIPRYGVVGAAYSSLLAQVGWIVAAFLIMPRAGVLAVSVKDTLKVLTVAAVFAAGLKLGALESDHLLVQLVPAATLYLLAVAVLNPANLMGQLRGGLARLKRT